MKNFQNISPLICCLIAVILFSACQWGPAPVFQSQKTIKDAQWAYKDSLDFSFDITDTAAFYNLYFLIRHTNAYPFSNIWVLIKTQKPGEKDGETVRLEIPMAESNGRWMGRGMGEIWEQRLPLTDGDHPMIFKKAGRYTISFSHDMRINPLPEVLNIGLRVEKKDKNSVVQSAPSP